MRLHVPDMACEGCLKTVTQAITALDPGARVAADMKGKIITVETARPAAEVVRSLAQAGYPASTA